MRMAAVGLVVMFFFFSVWQFGPSSPILPSQMPQAIPPALTSVLTAQSPRAQLTREGCVLLPYIVRENDSLAAIATQFAISETMILEINQLEADSIRPGMELQIPLCDFTPTGTSHAATSTITDTPVLYLTVSTPGG